jgi:thioester reductase-like protein
MAMRRTALVTGGTGFLGSFLIAFLLRHDCRVAAVVRGPEAEGRLLEALHEVGLTRGADYIARGQLIVCEGDVRAQGCGLEESRLSVLAKEVDEIWHCAASFKFQERYREEIAAHNITGTRHVLDFARRCNQQRTVPLFHVSTAYAAPASRGLVREVLPAADASFRNLYEWSKQEAERLVGAYRQRYELPVVILRPSIILGHSLTGRAARFTGYYDVIRAIYLLTQSLAINLGESFDRNLRLRILAEAAVRLNVVPVDFVVEAMWRVARSAPCTEWIFHVTNDHPPFLDFLFAQACAPLSVTGIELVDAGAFQRQPMSGLERIFNRKTQFQAPYLLDGPTFDNVNFRTLVPETVLPCPRADASLMRRVNEYYYREVLDRQFGVQQRSSHAASRKTSPSPAVSETLGTVTA